MQPNPTITLRARPVHITDGDTLRVEVSFQFIVRLLGGDTPEMRAKDKEERVRALEAKRAVYSLCYGEADEGQWAEPKDVIVEIPLTSDNLSDLLTLNRVLGRVWIDDEDLMELLIGKGLAKPRGGK